MSASRIVLTSDPSFTLVVEVVDGYHADVDAYQVSGWYDDGTRVYSRTLDDGSIDFTSDLDLADVSLNAVVKWDGCTHFYPSPYQHIDDLAGVREFARVYELMFKTAAKHIAHFDAECAGYDPEVDA